MSPNHDLNEICRILAERGWTIGTVCAACQTVVSEQTPYCPHCGHELELVPAPDILEDLQIALENSSTQNL